MNRIHVKFCNSAKVINQKPELRVQVNYSDEAETPSKDSSLFMYRIPLKEAELRGEPSRRGSVVDRLGRLGLVQIDIQVTEAAVAAQDLDRLLLHRGSCDAQILQTRKSRIFHVCRVKLDRNQRAFCLLKM